FLEKTLAGVVSVGSGEHLPVGIEVQAPVRGELKLTRFSVRCRYPAALFQAWAWINTDMSCIVYPQPAEHAPSPPDDAHADGEGQDAVVGNEDFAGLRDYRSGDPARRIAWKAYARTNVLSVKTFSGASSAPVELRYADAPGSLEQRLSILTRWCLDASEEGRPFSLVLNHTTTKTGRGRAHLDLCLRQLALHP
ncbi:MAG: DUF58 domain-containing protein, partial [Pseudomonadota bacterium]